MKNAQSSPDMRLDAAVSRIFTRSTWIVIGFVVVMGYVIGADYARKLNAQDARTEIETRSSVGDR